MVVYALFTILVVMLLVILFVFGSKRYTMDVMKYITYAYREDDEV